jgi:hypothetical protein
LDPKNIDRWIQEEFEPSSGIEADASMLNRNDLRSSVQQVEGRRQELSRILRDRYAVSCWYKNDIEPDAFWSLYSDRTTGIAVKSTVGRLKAALASSERDITLGAVSYLRSDQPIYFGGVLKQFFWKRKNFEYEQEVRAVVGLKSPTSMMQALNGVVSERGGIGVRVDLLELIDCVVISPLSPSWFEDSVKQLALRFDKALRFEQSALKSVPD